MAFTLWYLVPNMTRVTYSVFYNSRILRQWLKILLCFIVIYNLGILGTAIASTITVNGSNDVDGAGWYYDARVPGRLRYQWWTRVTAQVFYFNTIPVVLSIDSSFMLAKRWRHSLRPMHAIVSSSFSLLLCVTATLIWTTCIYTHPDTYWCPMRSPGWIPEYNKSPFPANTYFLLPFMLLLSYISYGLLLLTAVTAYDRDRRARRDEEAYKLSVIHQGSEDFQVPPAQAESHARHSAALDPHDRQAPTPASTSFTPPASISDAAQSTLRAASAARAPSKRSTTLSSATLPPSYEQGPSHASTRRYRDSTNVQGHVCSHCGQIDE